MFMQLAKKNNGNNKGVAAIEFALVLPLLLFMIIGVVEVSRFIITHQRIDKVSSQMADVISQTPAPASLDANSGVLRNTFEQLLGYTPDSGDGFVFSMIQTNLDNEPVISYQSALNGTASDLGAQGATIDTATLRGINIRPNDTIIAVETRVKHQNLFGDLLSQFNFGGNQTGSFDGQELYKPAFYIYRFNLGLVPLNASEQVITAIPPVCGYYRDAEDNKAPLSGNKIWDHRDYAIWPIPSLDSPHPCTCYGSKPGMVPPNKPMSDALKQRLQTCRPILLVDPYNCPLNDNCCSNPNLSSEIRNCKGCIGADDNPVAAANPNAPECRPTPPPPPPPCQGCECTNTCPAPPPPPPPPPCVGCACNNSCPPPPPPPPVEPPIIGS